MHADPDCRHCSVRPIRDLGHAICGFMHSRAVGSSICIGGKQWPMHMQDNRGSATLWRGHQGDLLAEGQAIPCQTIV